MKTKIKKKIFLLNSIKKFLLVKNKIQPNKNFLLSFSGGQDSNCLFFFIFLLKKQWNFNFFLVWCCHLWKKKSLLFFFHTSKIAFSLKSQLFINIVLKITFTEQNSRKLRLNLFFRISFFYLCHFVLTGHNSNDKNETFFFNLIRGSGLKGFSSLTSEKKFLQKKKNNSFFFEFFFFKRKNTIFKKKKKKKFKINKKINFFFILKKKNFIIHTKKKNFFFLIRPLVKLNRFFLKKINFFFSFPVYPDRSNEEKKIFRNRIRNFCIPSIQYFFNPQINVTFLKSSEIFCEKEKIYTIFLQKNSINFFLFHKKFICLNKKFFFKLPFFLQTQTSRVVFENKIFLKIKFSKILFFIGFLKKKKKKQWFFFPEIGLLLFHSTQIIFLKIRENFSWVTRDSNPELTG